MKQVFLIIIFSVSTKLCYSQNCINVNSKIDKNFSYENKTEDFEMQFNKNWGIAIENQKAILVFFKSKNGDATAGIVKNKNGIDIESAHDIDENLIFQLIKKIGINLNDKKLTNVKLKNIPAKQIEYNHKVYNLGDIHLMSGIIYMIVNDGHTYIFTFNSKRKLKDCYIPFFKKIMKNTYFGPEWY